MYALTAIWPSQEGEDQIQAAARAANTHGGLFNPRPARLPLLNDPVLAKTSRRGVLRSSFCDCWLDRCSGLTPVECFAERRCAKATTVADEEANEESCNCRKYRNYQEDTCAVKNSL